MSAEKIYASWEGLIGRRRNRLSRIPYPRLSRVVTILGVTGEPEHFTGPHQRCVNNKNIAWSGLDTGPTTVG